MQYYCSKESIAWLFYNVSSSFLLLFIFFYVTSIFLTKILLFFGGNLFLSRNNDGYEYVFSDEELEDENTKYNVESMQQDEPVEKIYNQDQKLNFLHAEISDQEEDQDEISSTQSDDEPSGSGDEDGEESYTNSEEISSSHSDDEPSDSSSAAYVSIPSDEEVVEEVIQARDTDSAYDCDTNDFDQSSARILDTNKSRMLMDNANFEDGRLIKEEKKEGTFSKEEKFLVFAPSNLESKKVQLPQKDEQEDIFGDSCTMGSTSKDSSEWRSSINYRDSGTDDPFSSSSRRSCPKWESYTIFQKYDEEMLFLDRLSVQKLHETESLRSIQHCPRSISERIVHKFANPKRTSSFHHNPYQELEGAYVAQICLTWEALNWNYKYFQTLRAARKREEDSGCPAYVAQQFQQFLVLLQRYVENEPYEHGRRPEIYARMRSLAPKLLQVPEYRDSDEEKREDGYCSRVSSNSFLQIMEDAIKTFMDFLKRDKKSGCQILAEIFRRKRRGSVDPTLLFLLNKVNKKKRNKLKELRRSGNCLRKRRLKMEQEMEILMALTDLKVVSRVLRTKGLNEEQMHWCEAKMSKVKVSSGRLQRDSSPLFFPAH